MKWELPVCRSPFLPASVCSQPPCTSPNGSTLRLHSKGKACPAAIAQRTADTWAHLVGPRELINVLRHGRVARVRCAPRVAVNARAGCVRISAQPKQKLVRIHFSQHISARSLLCRHALSRQVLSCLKLIGPSLYFSAEVLHGICSTETR